MGNTMNIDQKAGELNARQIRVTLRKKKKLLNKQHTSQRRSRDHRDQWERDPRGIHGREETMYSALGDCENKMPLVNLR